MSPQFDQLTAQALSLSPDERFALAERLWVSLEGCIEEDEAFLAELERRDAEMDAGAPTVSHEEVMRKLRDIVGE